MTVNEKRKDGGSEKDSTTNDSSVELETPEELSRSTKSSQSSSSPNVKTTKSGIFLEEPDQSGEEPSATVPLSLESFTFHLKLGAGSFGQVYLARDIIRQECVAIKVSNKRDLTESGYSLVERHVLKLSHESPYLIHGLAAFHTLNFVYYVMELATRGDLFVFMRKIFPLDTATIRFILAEVVCGTEFLHNKDILHRDLKPLNILLTVDGHVKITDFGMAAMGVHQGPSKRSIGTPGFAAPELVNGNSHGQGVDYFAIGVILCKLYTRRGPFPGKHPIEIEHSVLNCPPVYRNSSLTPEADNLLQGLLCKNQFQRLGVKGDIKKHPFFADINWEDVEARRMVPPANVMAAPIDLNINQTLEYAEMPNIIRSKHQKIFNQFSFVCPEWSRQYHPVIMQNQTWMDKVLAMSPFRKK
ncbi:protein kinase C theta type-like [Bufo bufo]|uniref:protein kinase C theta type-like n=1 Tax=Bufo bufo TaxID=8384 RepID=UPI001ABEDCA4|nr:protein kinase C theta type-like [Bufo bufo]